jgi:hypothetical protein
VRAPETNPGTVLNQTADLNIQPPPPGPRPPGPPPPAPPPPPPPPRPPPRVTLTASANFSSVCCICGVNSCRAASFCAKLPTQYNSEHTKLIATAQ